MRIQLLAIVGCLLVLVPFIYSTPTASMAARSATSEACSPRGWAPQEFGLKDHTIFWYNGAYYLASIYLTTSRYEDRFAYARSVDLCSWEELDPILTERQTDTWDEFRIWAPFVFEEDGVYYLYYTGVTNEYTQSTMLATSTNPADPSAWIPRGMIFQPQHPGMSWQGAGHWSDARDPTVLKANGRYYLYYTGADQDRGIVGVATADNPVGPWRDWGAMIQGEGGMLESPGVIEYDGWYYLFYNHTDTAIGPQIHVGPTPTGPWSAPSDLQPGWAHEIWTAPDGTWMTSYLTSYSVTIRPVQWIGPAPARLFIAEQVWRSLVPVIRVGE